MKRFVGVLLGLILAGLVSGCAKVGMKGTPFYTGEYQVRQGPAEDRVNLWPLLYYREPALSILWPIGEKTEDHFALRPLLSVYGLQGTSRVVNVLWPLAEFDQRTGDRRVFPFFWGSDYTVGFPLYWHFGDVGSKQGGTDSLFPLWIYSADDHHYDAHALWPILNVRNEPSGTGWRVWPVAGQYRDHNEKYQFAAWPFFHAWSRGGGTASGSTLVPLYWYSADPAGRQFFSLPYSRGSGSDGSNWQFSPPLFYQSADRQGSRFYSLLYCQARDTTKDRAWQLALPLWYSSRHGEERFLATLAGGYSRTQDGVSWMAVPLLASGHTGRDSHSLWVGGPLAHWGRDADTSTSHVFPFYYRSASTTDSLFVSLPWSSSTSTDGSGWQLIPPLFYAGGDARASRVITPLYAGGGTRDGAEAWSAVMPLYYRSRSPQGTFLATLLGGTSSDAAGHHWLIYPLLSGGRRGEGEGDVWIVAPFFHAEWNAKSSRNHLMPLYYWNGQERTFLSPLVATWAGADTSRTWLVPPLLSWKTSGPDRSDLWAAGPLAHWSWGARPGSRHVLPLFFQDPAKDALLSIPYSTWKGDDGRTTTLIPPLLSWKTEGNGKSDLWMAGPLAHVGWGEGNRRSHVFPLYYRDVDHGSFYSLPICRQESGDTRTWLIPPLLSQVERSPRRTELYAALGLFHERWTNDGNDGYLFPAYAYGKDYLYTPLFGWDSDPRDGFFYPLTPLVGVRNGSETAGGWFLPFFWHSRDRKTGDYRGSFLWGTYSQQGREYRSGLFPLYGYQSHGYMDSLPAEIPAGSRRGRDFWCLPACWYENNVSVFRRQTVHSTGPGSPPRPGAETQTVHTLKHGFFPLWHYSSSGYSGWGAGEFHSSGSLLLLLYDHKRDVKPVSAKPATEYVRKRVLWRLWHYEKENGDVSVDVFPAITYDRKADGFSKTSFLWRFFRYEKSAGGKKLDLLFIPILRTGHPAATPEDK